MNAYRHFDTDPLCDVFAGVDLHEALTRAPGSTYARQLLRDFEIEIEREDDIEEFSIGACGGDIIMPRNRKWFHNTPNR